MIDWTVDIWSGIPEQLCNLLDETFFYYPSTLDEYALAHYFAKFLTDDFTMLYVKAANGGKLKIHGSDYPDEKIEPTFISVLPDDFQPHMVRLLRILIELLVKKEFWLFDEDTLVKLSSCIGDMMVEKIKEMAMGFLE